jgi:hypothetical protein
MPSKKYYYFNNVIGKSTVCAAPLDAENVFLGGDDWHSLTRLVGGTPRKKASTSINQPFLKINNL